MDCNQLLDDFEPRPDVASREGGVDCNMLTRDYYDDTNLVASREGGVDCNHPAAPR